jgi:hypothetical protein
VALLFIVSPPVSHTASSLRGDARVAELDFFSLLQKCHETHRVMRPMASDAYGADLVITDV